MLPDRVQRGSRGRVCVVPARGRRSCPVRSPASGGRSCRTRSLPGQSCRGRGSLCRTPRVCASRRCAENMVLVGGAFCIDVYEASTESSGRERPRARSSHAVRDAEKRASARCQPRRGAPAGSRDARASAGCLRPAGKRLCSDAEWMLACRGPASDEIPVRQRLRQDCVQRPRELAVLEALRFGTAGIRPGEPGCAEQSALESAGRSRENRRIQPLRERLRRVRHGRQSSRVDRRSRRHISRRLLPRCPGSTVPAACT